MYRTPPDEWKVIDVTEKTVSEVDFEQDALNPTIYLTDNEHAIILDLRYCNKLIQTLLDIADDMQIKG